MRKKVILSGCPGEIIEELTLNNNLLFKVKIDSIEVEMIESKQLIELIKIMYTFLENENVYIEYVYYI